VRLFPGLAGASVAQGANDGPGFIIVKSSREDPVANERSGYRAQGAERFQRRADRRAAAGRSWPQRPATRFDAAESA
jgi:hypothetical protein